MGVKIISSGSKLTNLSCPTLKYSSINKIKELGYEIVPVSEMIYYENYEINHEGRQIKE